MNALEGFPGRAYNEAHSDEETWHNLTLNIITHGFGEDSNNIDQFYHAKFTGEHYMGGMTPDLLQSNFLERMAAYMAVLNSSIAELELMLPEPEISGAYERGGEYRFYKDLKTIVGFASTELFIIDNYLDTQLFDVYMENVGPGVKARVLTRQVPDSLKIVAEKFSKRGNFELRSSTGVHDRVVFCDGRCWVIGQSIKDAAMKKPTYIVEHSGADTMRTIYQDLWSSGATAVKG